MYKDEQLREAQGWIARAQEMDALQITPCRLNCENVPSSITSSGLVAKDRFGYYYFFHFLEMILLFSYVVLSH